MLVNLVLAEGSPGEWELRNKHDRDDDDGVTSTSERKVQKRHSTMLSVGDPASTQNTEVQRQMVVGVS
jgi:hypothetical protein